MRLMTPPTAKSQLALFLLFLTAGLAALPLSAQNQAGSIQGQVTPAHDHELAQATARIEALGIQTVIAGDGTFRFDSVPPGSWRVEVRLATLGAAAATAEVAAGQATELTIELAPGGHFEEVLFVTAPGSRQSEDLASAASSLSGEELRLRLEASLGETLSNEAGINSTFFGAGASRPIIRGLTGDRVRMLEGGIGTGDVSDISADHAVATDPVQAERIEILRGPATLLYGSSAIGGAVNVIDERIPTVRASRPLSGTVDLRGGSVADERLGAFNLKGGAGDWAWHLDAMTRETDPYEIPGAAALEDEHEDEHEHEDDGEHHEEDGHDDHEDEEEAFGFVPNTDLETSAVRLGATRFFKSGYFGASVSGLDSDYGIPSGAHAHGEDEDHHDEDGEHEGEEHEDDHGDEEHGHGEEEETVRIDMQQKRVDLKGELRPTAGPFQALRFRLGATDYEHQELEGDEVGTRFSNDFLETRIELVTKERERSRGSVGVQFTSRDLEAVGDEAFLPKTSLERYAAFGFQEYEQGPLTWQLGARFETQDADPSGQRSVSSDGLSGSLGLVWDLNEVWSVASSLAHSVKLPAPEELFSDGVHVASQTFEIGDPGLTEETALGFDVSLRKTEGLVTGEITVFRQEFDDFIYQAFTGQEREGFAVVQYSQNDARFTGAEIEARFELYEQDEHHLHLRTVADWVDAELSSGENVPRIPPLRFGGGLHYHSENWSAMLEARHVDRRQDDVAQGETPTSGYTLINASLSRRFLFGNQLLDVLLRGRNLTDEEARSHTSLLKNVAPLPGRDVSLALRLWF